jgi:hypothetical protein
MTYFSTPATAARGDLMMISLGPLIDAYNVISEFVERPQISFHRPLESAALISVAI